MEKKTFNVMVNNKEFSLYFRKPKHREIDELDLLYRCRFSDAVRKGMVSEAELRKIAQRNGTWTKVDDESLATVSLEISLLEDIVVNKDNTNTDEQIKEAANKLTSKRAEQISLITEKVNLSINSAESYANDQKMHKFIELCCMNAIEDIQFFVDEGHYKTFIENQPDAMSEIFKQAHYFEYGSPQEATESWPEIQYLKKEAEKIKAEQEKKAKEEIKENIKEEIKEEVKSE